MKKEMKQRLFGVNQNDGNYTMLMFKKLMLPFRWRAAVVASGRGEAKIENEENESPMRGIKPSESH